MQNVEVNVHTYYLYLAGNWLFININNFNWIKSNRPMYRIAENVGRRKHWRIQLFRSFGEENFGEWPTNKIRILNIP